MDETKKLQKKNTILFGLFLCCILLYGIGRIYGFVLYPDEFGYWASAARVLGYDWTEIASLGSYYSYGYSLLLIPILLFVPNPIVAYRVAVVVNVFLLFLTFIVLIRIGQRFVADKNKTLLTYMAAIAVFYPTWLLYMQTTLAEILIVFLFSLVCYLFLRYLEQETIGRLCLLVAASFYLYTVHMRTVAVLIAALLVVGLKFVRDKMSVRQICIFLLVIIAGFGLLSGMKALIQNTVYSHADVQALAWNDYAGQWNKLASLFTLAGFKEFLISLIGKIYYLGLASFGLFYFGIYYLVRKRQGYFFLFLLLSVTGEILIGALYTKGYGRADGLLYGRYDEHILPVIMMLGIYQLWLISKNIKRCLIIAAGMIGGSFSITFLIEMVLLKHQMDDIHGGYFIAGMSYLLRYIDFEPENYFWKACLLNSLFIVLCIGVVCLIRRIRGLQWLFFLLIGLEIYLGLSLSEQYVYRYNCTTYGNTKLAEILEEKSEEGKRIVSYGNNGDDAFISSIQFILRDTKITLLMEQDMLKNDDLVIISSKQQDVEFLEEKYAECEAYGSFWLYYTD